MKFLDRNSTLHLGVHSGPMHADEVFATAALLCIFADVDVIRTRDVNLLEACDMRVDVGDDYNHARLTYDHHMSWFKTRHDIPPRKRLNNGEFKTYKRGPLRAGFGLIWLHYGTEIVRTVVEKSFKESIIRSFKDIDYIRMWKSIDNGLVAHIDAIDNGEADEFDLNAAPFRTKDLSRLIAGYNPTVLEQRSLSEDELPAIMLERFMMAVNWAKLIITREICDQGEQIYFREQFTTLLMEAKGRNEHILVLENYIHWAGPYAMAGDLTNGIEMIVFKSSDGKWMCQTPFYYQARDSKVYPPKYKDGTRRKYKHQAPERVCGLKDAALVEQTGIKDATFVHKGGHLGAANTREAAIELAQFFIDHERM